MTRLPPPVLLMKTPPGEDAKDIKVAEAVTGQSGANADGKRRLWTSSRKIVVEQHGTRTAAAGTRSNATLFTITGSTSEDDAASHDPMERQRQAQDQRDTLMAEVLRYEAKQATSALGRQNSTVLDFVAGHACCSQQVRKILGGPLVHQTVSQSNRCMEMTIRTQHLACQLFGADHCELVGPGSSALGVACYALLQSLHVTTYSFMTTALAPSSSDILSKLFPDLCCNERLGRHIQLLATPRGDSVQHPFDPISLERLGSVLEKHRPHCLILGGETFDLCSDTTDPSGEPTSCVPQLWEYDLLAIRTLCDKYDCRLIYDMTKVADLVAGQVFQADLLRFVDVAVCASGEALHAGGGRNCQGFLLYNDHGRFHESVQQVLQEIHRHVGNNSHYRSQQLRETAALSMALLEFSARGRDYGRQVLSNTRALASALEKRGFVVFGGRDKDNTDIPLLTLQQQQQRRLCSHQIVLDLEASFSLSPPEDDHSWSATAAAKRLRMAAGIHVTPQELPLDNAPAGATGLRLATAVLTRRGFVEVDMSEFAQAFGDLLHLGQKSHDDDNVRQTQPDACVRRNLQKVLKGNNEDGNASYCHFSLDEAHATIPDEIMIFPMTKDGDDSDYLC